MEEIRWQGVEDDIRRLWRHVPLTPDKVERYTKSLIPLLSSDGNAQQALAHLEGLVLQLEDSEEVGALAAVLGFIPDIHEKTVPGRLAAFAVSRMPKQADTTDITTARRRAERGATLIAKRLASELMTDDRNDIEIRIWGSPAQTYCAVTLTSYRETNPVQVLIRSPFHWTTWKIVEHPSQYPPPRYVEPDFVDPRDEGLLEVDYEIVYESSCSLKDSHGQASLRIELFETPQPCVNLVVQTDFPCSVFAGFNNVAYSLVISMPRESWRAACDEAIKDALT